MRFWITMRDLQLGENFQLAVVIFAPGPHAWSRPQCSVETGFGALDESIV